MNCCLILLRHPRCSLALANIAIGVLGGIILRNELFLAKCIALRGLLVAVPLTALISLFSLPWLISKSLAEDIRPDRTFVTVISYATTVGFSSIASLLALVETGELIDYWEACEVTRYVTRAASILDQIKAKDGAYPTTLPVELIGKPPFLLRNFGKYEATKDSFYFVYVNEPAGWAGGEGALEFDSTHRDWRADEYQGVLTLKETDQ